jgi:hypothetical protein
MGVQRAFSTRVRITPRCARDRRLCTAESRSQGRDNIDRDAVRIDDQEAANAVIGKVLRSAHHHGVVKGGGVDRVDSLGRSNVEVERIRTGQAGTGEDLRTGGRWRREHDGVGR